MSDRRVIRTMCPMNCHPTLCGMLVEVEQGRVVGVTGDRDNPDSQGFLCIRGQASREIIDNPRRLLHLLVRARRTDDWRRATWDEALDLIVTKMRAVGREAVGTWSGHGLLANNYGTRIPSELLRRFANLYGCQWWNGTIICWGLGAFGVGLTGVLEVHTKEDMGAHSAFIALWGANLASQPNTARHLVAARRRGAHVVAIDVRETEATAQADEVFLVRPGTDAALALAMMHVIIGDKLYDRQFVAGHTVGFDELQAHVAEHSPTWAARVTGIPAERIAALARRYATTRPAMIVLGGSSMHKGANGWQGGRAVACLPALTGHLGVPGGGLGPRHGASVHGQALRSIAVRDRRPPGDYVPNQMARMTEALLERRGRAPLLFGADMLSSFADAAEGAEGRAPPALCVRYDPFLNAPARRLARRLPGSALRHAFGQGRVLLGAGAGARTSAAAGVRGPARLVLSARVPPGADADAVPRLLRARARPAHPGQGGSRALPLDRAVGRGGPGRGRRRADPPLQRAGGVPSPRAGHRQDPGGHGMDAGRLGRPQPADVRTPFDSRRRRRSLRVRRGTGGLRRDDRGRPRLKSGR